jgi:hypothetical protein
LKRSKTKRGLKKPSWFDWKVSPKNQAALKRFKLREGKKTFFFEMAGSPQKTKQVY